MEVHAELKAMHTNTLMEKALVDMARNHEVPLHLNHLLTHFVFGSRDIVHEDPRADLYSMQTDTGKHTHKHTCTYSLF
jgi:hypothetical protein